MPNLINRLKGRDTELTPRIQTDLTGTVVITAADNGITFTNAGAEGSVAYTLPAALKGMLFTFVNGNHASDTMVITASGTEEIRIAGVGINGVATLAEEGEVMTIQCLIAGTWTCVNTVGTVALS